MSDVQLGLLAPEDAARDATHVAVVPMKAKTELRPGDHVGIISDGVAGISAVPIGIVDPYLDRNVKTGERFYLCLYPRSVTGLRHHYDHPALDGGWSPVTSRDWIEKWAASEHIGYEELIAHAQDWVSTHDGKYSGEYWWCDGGRFEGVRVPDEFWDHYDRVTKTETPAVKRGSFFTCSC